MEPHVHGCLSSSEHQSGRLHPQTPANFLSADFLAPKLQRNWEKWQEHRTVRYFMSQIQFFSILGNIMQSYSLPSSILNPIILINCMRMLFQKLTPLKNWDHPLSSLNSFTANSTFVISPVLSFNFDNSSPLRCSPSDVPSYIPLILPSFWRSEPASVF